MGKRYFVAGPSLAALAVVMAGSLAAFGQDSAAPQPATPPPALDEGLLDPAWFGSGAPLEFHENAQIDYLWVKPGFELRGKRVYFATWEAPRLPAARDDRDAKAAAKFTAEFPPLLRETLSKKLSPPVVPVNTEAEAEVVLAGRVADCNAGNMWAYVWPATTIDVKVLDARTGELLVAVHNRKVARPQTSLHSNVLLKLSTEGFQDAYANAKPAKQ